MEITKDTPISELYHSEDELMHWKYIKREKKNGKWVYTYDSEGLKNDVKNFVNDPTGKKAKQQYRQAQQRNIDATNNINSRYMYDIEYKKAANKAEKSALKGQKFVPKSDAEKAYVRDRVHEEHSKIELNRAKQKYDKSLVGKLDKARDAARTFVDDVADTVKDKLGYDEKERFYDVLSAVNNKANYDQRTAGKPVGTSEDIAKILGMGEEYMKAFDEYLKTPLGLINEPSESIKARIDSAKDWIENLFDRSGAPEPVLSPVGEENILKENIIKENKIEQKTIEEKKINQKAIKEKEIKQEIVVDTTLTRKKATEALKKIDDEYKEASKAEQELYKKAKSLENSSDTKAFEQAKSEFEKAFAKSLELRDRKDECNRAKQELEDKLDSIEHDLSVIKSLTPTEETRRKEKEYHQQIEDAIDEYYKIINDK